MEKAFPTFMVNGLKLGDLVLDPRRVLYISSLRAVVCAGAHDALGVRITEGLRGVIERLDAALTVYKPESFIMFGNLNREATIASMARRWGQATKIHFVCSDPDPDARSTAELMGCEVYNELVWGKYRFVDEEAEGSLEVQLMTIAGSPNYGVRVGSFGGMKLAVFLKGLGRLVLPSINPEAPTSSVFTKELERHDVFAVGHQRILPMGKVQDLKPFKGIVRGVPISMATLGAKRRISKESDPTK